MSVKLRFSEKHSFKDAILWLTFLYLCFLKCIRQQLTQRFTQILVWELQDNKNSRLKIKAAALLKGINEYWTFWKYCIFISVHRQSIHIIAFFETLARIDDDCAVNSKLHSKLASVLLIIARPILTGYLVFNTYHKCALTLDYKRQKKSWYLFHTGNFVSTSIWGVNGDCQVYFSALALAWKILTKTKNWKF